MPATPRLTACTLVFQPGCDGDAFGRYGCQADGATRAEGRADAVRSAFTGPDAPDVVNRGSFTDCAGVCNAVWYAYWLVAAAHERWVAAGGRERLRARAGSVACASAWRFAPLAGAAAFADAIRDSTPGFAGLVTGDSPAGVSGLDIPRPGVTSHPSVSFFLLHGAYVPFPGAGDFHGYTQLGSGPGPEASRRGVQSGGPACAAHRAAAGVGGEDPGISHREGLCNGWASGAGAGDGGADDCPAPGV